MAYVVIILRCMFKLLILDVDGVLTTGCKTYDLEGNVISKEFNDKDFTAIKRFKEKGLKVCFPIKMGFLSFKGSFKGFLSF